jgi:hypothetical protein
MATRTFSYTPNESGTISGTTRVGDITIGDPSLGYASFPGIKFWNGPEEVEGKIILAMADAEPKHTGAGALNEPSHIGFEEFEDADEFKEWLEKTLGQAFETPEAANTAANLNGMWTNYAGGDIKISYSYFVISDCDGTQQGVARYAGTSEAIAPGKQINIENVFKPVKWFSGNTLSFLDTSTLFAYDSAPLKFDLQDIAYSFAICD